MGLVLVRPEGAALAVALSGHFWLTRPDLPRSRRVAPLVAIAFAVSAYYLWHTWCFGHWAPNTYYAKRSDTWWYEVIDGFDYVVRSALDPEVLIGVIVLLGAPLLWLWKSRWKSLASRDTFALTSFLGLLALATVVAGGGDGYPGGRFLAVPIAMATIALAIAIGELNQNRYWAIGLAAAAIAFASWKAFRVEWDAFERIAAWPMDTAKDFGCELRVVAALQRAGIHTYAQSDHQHFKLLSDETRVFDLSTLNDREAAHFPWAGHNIWGKTGAAYPDRLPRAEVAKLGVFVVSSTPATRYTVDELKANPKLASRLLGGTLPLWDELSRFLPASIPACGGYFNVLVRGDVAPRLSEYLDPHLPERP